MRTEHPPVRDTDPYTSWAAGLDAAKLDEYHVKLSELIYTILDKFGPLTHDQLIEAVNKVKPASPSSVRTRTSELVERGSVERHPSMVAKSRYGRASLLWRVIEK